MTGGEAAAIARVARLRVRHDPRPPAVPGDLAARARERFARLSAENPRLYDGDVLLFRDVAVAGDTFSAVAVPAKYALLTQILAEPAARAGLSNVFGAVAPISRDGALLMGRMGRHTFEPGAVKLAAGTPDPEDVAEAAGTVDLEASMARELREETGLAVADGVPARFILVVRAGPYCAVVRPVLFPLDGETLAGTVTAFIEAEADPELSAAILVRGPADPGLAEAPPIQRLAVEALFGAAPFAATGRGDDEGRRRP